MNFENTQADQELDKNLRLEEAKQHKKNLEQQKETKENPVEEDSAIRLSDINECITKKEEDIQNTQNKINDIRNQLGLPSSDEVPPSITNDRDSIEKLNQEKSQIEIKDGTEANEKSEETKRFERNFKTVLEDISTQSKIMFDALYERQQERLTPLQSNDNFQMMVSNIRNLTNFEGRIDENSISEITEDINKLSRLFDDIKVQPVGGQIRENYQNLEKLGYGAKRFSSSLEDSAHKIPIEMSDKVMEEKSIELRKGLYRLSEQVKNMWLFAAKLRSRLV